MDNDAEPAVKDIVLNESDRELVRIAARLLMAQEPGEKRAHAAERLVGDYRADLSDVHPGVEPETLEEMALNFAGALLREMERLADTEAGDENEAPSSSRLAPGRRVVAALAQLLAALDPRH